MDEYWLWLINIRDMYQSKIKRIMTKFANAKELFEASEDLIRKSGVIEDKDIHRIIESRENYSYDSELEKLSRNNTKFISADNDIYPERLRYIYDPPYGLFIRGNTDVLGGPVIAMVGARNCTEYGRKIAESFAKCFSANNITVVSGLARGIDAASHRGALKAEGTTIGILGCGVDICYPRENIEIFTDMQLRGAVISEYPLGCPPVAWKFPARNRIISGLADAIIVIEAREKSGSLITVEHALEQGKDVYAVPGRIGDKLSEGCNRLIRSGAELIISPENVIQELSERYSGVIKFYEKKEYTIAKDLEVVYSVVDLFPKNVQTIIEETGEPYNIVLDKLMRLQLQNMISEPVKGYYSRNIE